MELSEAIQKRHSFRFFAEDPIDRAVLGQLVEAAAHAPSSHNEQPWRFHVCTGETRTKLGEIMAMTTVYLDEYIDVLGEELHRFRQEFYANLGNAPVVFAVACRTSTDELDRINTLVSTGAAIENLLLKATDLGIGSCSITFSFWVRDQIAELLRLTDDWEIISLIVVGKPAAPAEAPRHSLDIATYHDDG